MGNWTVAIIGAGAMGHGFAAHFVRFGHEVVLVDHRRSNLERAKDRIRDVSNFLADHELSDLDPDAMVTEIEYTLDQGHAVSNVDLVLETISEDLEAKRTLFGKLAIETDDETVLATNTSGLPITEIANSAQSATDRIIGCHWWYPPYLLRPVEVIPGAQTDPTIVERVHEFLRTVDRDPISVERDVPGFIWNRVQMAVLRECLHIVESDIASPDAVNRAIRDGYATRTAAIGPLETVDIAGLDLFRTIAADLYPHLSDRTEPNPIYDRLIQEGRTGIEGSGGFLSYDSGPATVTRRRDDRIAAIRMALEQSEGGST